MAYFPAIPLTGANFGHRYSALATMFRHLHNEVIRDNFWRIGFERFLLQINRPRMISITHPCAANAFVLPPTAIISAYFGHMGIVNWLFLGSSVLTIGSLLFLTRKIQLANSAPDVHLLNLESQPEL